MSTWLKVALGFLPVSKEKDPLLSCLAKLGEETLKKHPNVNDGGCCVYASTLGLELARRNIDTRIIVASGHANICGADIDEVRHRLQNPANIYEWNEYDVNFNHVAIEFVYRGSVYHHDSKITGDYSETLDSMPIYKGRLTVLEAKHLAETPRGWNEVFDRDQIPAMRQLIAHHMGLYDFKNRKKQLVTA